MQKSIRSCPFSHFVYHKGKRLLKQWLCSPLLRIRDIRERQAALTVLNDSGIGSNVRAGLKGMPDLERLVAAIHVAGVKVSEDHPESRAIYYENVMYNAAKIKKLCQCLDALVVANNLFKVCRLYSCVGNLFSLIFS